MIEWIYSEDTEILKVLNNHIDETYYNIYMLCVNLPFPINLCREAIPFHLFSQLNAY